MFDVSRRPVSPDCLHWERLPHKRLHSSRPIAWVPVMPLVPQIPPPYHDPPSHHNHVPDKTPSSHPPSVPKPNCPHHLHESPPRTNTARTRLLLESQWRGPRKVFCVQRGNTLYFPREEKCHGPPELAKRRQDVEGARSVTCSPDEQLKIAPCYATFENPVSNFERERGEYIGGTWEQEVTS